MVTKNQSPSSSKKTATLLVGRRWFDAFVIGSIDPMIVFDEKLDVKFVNNNGAKLFNRKASELIGANIESCGPLGSIVAPILHDVLKLRTGLSCDHEIPEERHLRVFQGSYSPVLDEDGLLVGIFSVLREVTDRRDLIRQLVASNKRLESHAKALEVFDMVSESDLSGQILYANDKFCAASKYTRGEIIGQNYRIFNSGNHSKEFFRELWETISRGQPWFGELKNRAKDGSTFWVQTIITPIFNEDGSIARFLSIQQDITNERDERFRVAGAALRYRQILDSGPFLEVSLDLEQKIVFCNTILLKATGYNESEIVEKNWFETFILPGEKQALQAILLTLLGEQKPMIQFQSQVFGKDGKSREVAWRATTIKNQEGHIYGIHLLGEEVKADQAPSDFLKQDVIGFVSHELKGGLVSIQSGLEIIQDELDSPQMDRNHLKSIVQKTLAKTTYIDDLSRNMMENLRAGSRLVQIRRQPTSLRTVLLGVWNRVIEETEKSRNIHFDLQIPEEDIVVQWDPLKIEQTERNLLENAIQFSKPSGGQICLSARKANENILISVSDEGIGIPSENIESLFTSFTRGSNTQQSQANHFGIGLKLCKDIVSQHLGRIWIESKLDFGTTVFFMIPADPKTRLQSSNSVSRHIQA